MAVLYKDKEELMEILKYSDHAGELREASTKLRNDKEVIKAALDVSNNALSYAGNKIKDDKDFIIECIANAKFAGDIFIRASDRLQEDKDVISALYKKDPVVAHKLAPKTMTIDERLSQAKEIRESNTKEKVSKERTEPER